MPADTRHPLEILEDGWNEFQFNNLPRGQFLGYLGKGDGSSTIVNTMGTARREIFCYTASGGLQQPAFIAVLSDGAGIFYKDSASYVNLPVILQYLPGETWPTVVAILNDPNGRDPLTGKNVVENEISTATGDFHKNGSDVATGDFDMGDHALKRTTYLDLKSASAPSNPSSGYFRAYLDSGDSHIKYRDNSGTVVDLTARVKTSPSADADNVIQPTANTVTPLTVKGASSQSDNLTEWQNSSSTVLARVDAVGNVKANALNFGLQTVTLASDAFTPTAGVISISSESGTADNLATITTGTFTTTWIVIIVAAATHTITVKHGTGNIKLSSGADYALSGDKMLMLCYNGSNWANLSM